MKTPSTRMHVHAETRKAKLGRPAKKIGQEDPGFAPHRAAMALHSLLCSCLFEARADKSIWDESGRAPAGVSVEEVREFLEIACQCLIRELHLDGVAPLKITEDDIVEFAGANSLDRGGGVCKVAGRLVSRVLGKSDGWFARHVVQGPYYLQRLQPGPSALALLPPLIEPNPREYVEHRLLPLRPGANRTDELRRFAIAWNRLMRDPKHVEARREALAFFRQSAASRQHVVTAILDRVFYCEECATSLDENDLHFCSEDHSAMASRRRRGRA